MSWAVISDAYGKDHDDPARLGLDYKTAIAYALAINSKIDHDEDKAYRSVVCIVGWTWHQSGERVYNDNDLRLYGSQSMDYYEVPMPPLSDPDCLDWC